jgi:hypothetical protein
VPLPPWVGYPLLWHLVQPGRMVLAGGLLLVTFAFLLAQRRPLRFSGRGCLSFALTLILAWALFKRPHNIGLAEAYRDWVYVVPVAAAGTLITLGLLTPVRANSLLLGSAAALGLVSFGTFNPIQKTTPIFAEHHTAVTAEFDRRLATEGRGFLLVPWGTSFFAHSGLPLIARGYPSVAYATFDPALEMWRKLFPELPQKEFDRAFNNVGTYTFADIPEPRWQPIYTMVPIAPLNQSGVTVCDLIRPSRAAMAAAIGCPVPAPVGAAPSRPD